MRQVLSEDIESGASVREVPTRSERGSARKRDGGQEEPGVDDDVALGVALSEAVVLGVKAGRHDDRSRLDSTGIPGAAPQHVGSPETDKTHEREWPAAIAAMLTEEATGLPDT